MSNRENSDHLANLSDGAGCAEVWEHLSEQRETAATEESDDDSESVDAEDAADETAEESDDAPEQDAAAVPCP